MLDFNVQTQIDFLTWIQLGGVNIEAIENEDIGRFIELSMDFADASLVVLSEKLKIKEIITIDSDYYVYRTVKREMIENIFNYK